MSKGYAQIHNVTGFGCAANLKPGFEGFLQDMLTDPGIVELFDAGSGSPQYGYNGK